MALQHSLKGPVPASGDPNDTVTTGPIQAGPGDRIVGAVFSDQPGTLHIQQSGDGSIWIVDTTFTITANDGKGFSEEVVLAYAQVSFENSGPSATTQFQLYARISSAGTR